MVFPDMPPAPVVDRTQTRSDPADWDTGGYPGKGSALFENPVSKVWVAE